MLSHVFARRQTPLLVIDPGVLSLIAHTLISLITVKLASTTLMLDFKIYAPVRLGTYDLAKGATGLVFEPIFEEAILVLDG